MRTCKLSKFCLTSLRVINLDILGIKETFNMMDRGQRTEDRAHRAQSTEHRAHSTGTRKGAD